MEKIIGFVLLLLFLLLLWASQNTESKREMNIHKPGTDIGARDMMTGDEYY